MSGTSKASATRKMRIAQVAGLCMVALAAGAVMFKPGLPERPTLTDPNTIVDGQDTQANANSNQDGRRGIDADMTGDGLNQAGNVKPDVKPVDTGAIDVAETPKPTIPTDTTRGWMYLGGVFEPKTNFAFVSINGSQRMLRQGAYLPEYDATVISVEPGKIEIEREGMREQISLAEPAETLVSVSSTTVQQVGNSPFVPGRPVTPADARQQRLELENNPDIEKRRAEMYRRQRDREDIER